MEDRPQHPGGLTGEWAAWIGASGPKGNLLAGGSEKTTPDTYVTYVPYAGSEGVYELPTL
jgi:hypothetical protein